MEFRVDCFTLKSICLITGASKGYGQSVAIKFAELLPPSSMIIIVARNEAGLQKTKSLMERKCCDKIVRLFVMDLSIASRIDYERMLKESMGDITSTDFKQSIVIHNAGSLGDISIGLSAQTEDESLQRYWKLNLTSITVLNAVWHQFFSQVTLKQRIVVGISSICALQPFKSWGIYCAGKKLIYCTSLV